MYVCMFMYEGWRHRVGRIQNYLSFFFCRATTRGSGIGVFLYPRSVFQNTSYLLFLHCYSLTFCIHKIGSEQTCIIWFAFLVVITCDTLRSTGVGWGGLTLYFLSFFVLVVRNS